MKIRNMVQVGLFAALICICSWLYLPVGGLFFTLQTFGVFLTLFLLGGKTGCWAILTYLALGAVGLPVFSGFRGGFGALLDVTGGYLWGFLLAGLIYRLLGKKLPVLAAIAGLLACYLAGTLWCAFSYFGGNVAAAAVQCVLPYVIPDAAKLWFAFFVAKKLKPFVY